MISSLPQQVTISSQPSISSKVGTQATEQNTPLMQMQIYANEPSDTFERKEKIVKAAVISTVAIGAVIGGFTLAKKGVLGKNLEKYANNAWDKITSLFKKTPSNISSAAKTAETQTSAVQDETIKGVKKFFSNGKEIEGVKLEKGKAVLSDGSKFTGEMETLTKKGTKVNLTYKDGFITKSTKNGKLYKTFDSIDGFDRTSGTLIKEYKQGIPIKELQHFYNKDGIISKAVDCKLASKDVKEFADKRLIADYKIDNTSGKINGTKFDANGTKRSFEYDPSDSSIKETIEKDNPNPKAITGKILGVEGKLEPSADASELIATKPIKDIKKITTYNQIGVADKTYEINNGLLTISNPIPNCRETITVSAPSVISGDGKLQITHTDNNNISKECHVYLRDGKLIGGSGGTSFYDMKSDIKEIDKALDIAKKTGAKIKDADIIQTSIKYIKNNWI